MSERPDEMYGAITLEGGLLASGEGSPAGAFEASIDESCFEMARGFALMLFGDRVSASLMAGIIGPAPTVRRRLSRRERRWVRDRSQSRRRSRWSKGPRPKNDQRLLDWAMAVEEGREDAAAMPGEIVGLGAFL